MELRYARPRTRRQDESPVGDWRRRFHGRLRGVASAAVKSPSPPFGFRPAAGHERRPSPHTKTPASRASRTEGEKVGRWSVLTFREISCAVKAAFVSRRGEEARKGGGDAPTPARRSLKPGGGKSPPDRQRRSFAASGFVVARSADSRHTGVSSRLRWGR